MHKNEYIFKTKLCTIHKILEASILIKTYTFPKFSTRLWLRDKVFAFENGS